MSLSDIDDGVEVRQVSSAIRNDSAVRKWQRNYHRWLCISDVAVAGAVVALAQVLRFGEVSGPATGLRGMSQVSYTIVSVVILTLWVSALAIYRTRSRRLFGNGLEESRRVLTATLSVFGVVAVFSMLFQLDVARGYLAIALPLGVMSLLASRWLSRKYVAACRRRGKFVTAVLAIGHQKSVRALATSFAKHPGDGLRVVGACGPGMHKLNALEISETERIPVLSAGVEFAEAVIRSGADAVVLTSGHLTPDEIRNLSWQLERLDVDLIVSPGMVDVSAPRLSVSLVGGSPLILVDKPQYHGAKRFTKRAFDIVFSALMLLAVSPIMLVAALAVKLTSRGPVFYLSERIGLEGVPFRMVKFRSMVIDADKKLADISHLNESVGGVLFKIREDPRVTTVGKFMRRFSIDELPQFFNVLGGQMSVVGPRPPLAKEVQTYDIRARRRLLVRPGITGLWQVSGRSDLSWEESVRLDLSYVENWSMANDLVIAAGTVKAVFGKAGAY